MATATPDCTPIRIMVELDVGAPLFREDFIKQGRRGGKKAAEALHQSILVLLRCFGPRMFISDLGHITLTGNDIARLPKEQRRVIFDESKVHVDMKVSMDVSGARRRRRVKGFVRGLVQTELSQKSGSIQARIDVCSHTADTVPPCWMPAFVVISKCMLCLPRTCRNSQYDTIEAEVNRNARLGGTQHVMIGATKFDIELLDRIARLRAEGMGVAVVTGGAGPVAQAIGATVVRLPDSFV